VKGLSEYLRVWNTEGKVCSIGNVQDIITQTESITF